MGLFRWQHADLPGVVAVVCGALLACDCGGSLADAGGGTGTETEAGGQADAGDRDTATGTDTPTVGGQTKDAEPDATPASSGRMTLANAMCIDTFALAGPKVYWTTKTNLMSVPKTGGSSTTLAALGLSTGSSVLGLAVSGTTAYWVDDNQGDPLMAAPIMGGAATTVSSGNHGLSSDLTASSAGIFFLGGSGLSNIMTVPPGGSAPTSIATGSFGAMTADGHSVYASDLNTNAIVSIPVTGGTPITLATVPNAVFVGWLVTDGAYVYWVNLSTSQFLRLPIGGGTPTMLFVFDGSVDPGVAVDGTNAYWTSTNSTLTSSTLWKMPVGGGTPVPLATSPTVSAGLAVDEASVYWLTGYCGAQSIVKITPK